jgi:putative nucleotidyltransferase with HDIG domain
MNREDAFELLTRYTESESLIKHAIAVEAAVRAYAVKFDEDTDVWGITGLLHDFDYEKYPSLDDHAAKGAAILEEMGYPEEIIYAIRSHNDSLGVERVHLLDKALFAVDELTGLITAAALVRPSKSVLDLAAKSVRKKMKDKAFARAVNRDEIIKGAEDLGVELNEHITFVIEAMRGVADELGLKGQA